MYQRLLLPILLLLLLLSGFTAKAQTAGALTFKSGDFVQINPTLGNFGTGDFTIELRVRTTLQHTYFISKRKGCGQENFWNLHVDQGKLIFEFQESATTPRFSLVGTSLVADGNWHHVAITRSNGWDVKMYVDGAVQASGSSTINFSSPEITYLAKNPCVGVNGSQNFVGGMDEIRIWSRGLCAVELMHSSNCSWTENRNGLVASYSCNQGTAGGSNSSQTTLWDQTGNNNGALVNFTLSGTNSNFTTGVTNTCNTNVATITSNSPVGIGSTINLGIDADHSFWWTGPNGYASGSQYPSIANAQISNSGEYNGSGFKGGCFISGKVNVSVLPPAGAIRFDGANDYIQVENSTLGNFGTGNFTIQ